SYGAPNARAAASIASNVRPRSCSSLCAGMMKEIMTVRHQASLLDGAVQRYQTLSRRLVPMPKSSLNAFPPSFAQTGGLARFALPDQMRDTRVIRQPVLRRL